MSFRNPLQRAAGLGTAKEGVPHWVGQRVTAVALLLLSAWFLASFVRIQDLRHVSVVTWMRAPMNAVLLTLLIITLVYHSQLGLRVVTEDYVSHKHARVLLLLIINFVLAVLGALGIFSVLRVALGGAA